MERRILLVEGSPTQARRVRLLLEADGYAVGLALHEVLRVVRRALRGR